MSPKRPDNESEFLDRLADLLGNKGDLNDQELRAYLTEYEIAADELIASIHSIVQTELKRTRLAWQAKARRERLEAATRIADEALSTVGREALLRRLQTLLTGQGPRSPALVVQFNKLTALPEEDLRSLLADIEQGKKLAQEFPATEGPEEED
jgi:hypothetical protein